MSNTLDYISFYEGNKRRSFLFAKSYVHNDLAAEDIASEAFIKIWELNKQNEKIENPQKLLYTILKNKCLDYLRHEKIKREAFSNILEMNNRELEIRISTLEAADPDKIFESDVQNIISKTLEELPTQTRIIFEKYRLDGICKKDIADTHEISIKGVDYHLTKAFSYLKKKLIDYLPIIGFVFFIFFN